MVIKMFTKPGRRMDKHCENFNKEKENIRKQVTKLKKSAIAEHKNIPEGFNSKLDETEGAEISDLEDGAVKLI